MKQLYRSRTLRKLYWEFYSQKVISCKASNEVSEAEEKHESESNFVFSMRCVFSKKNWQPGKRGGKCRQTGKSECIKEILVHLFKVDAKHSYRRVVHQRV